jgi:hypothetical protein
MDGIPPARDTDAEDVVWALQTAEALWKRNERGDAIVWLRRAAQAAGEANDDDRALLLAREAAELTEAFAHASSAALSQPPVTEGSVSGVAIDSLLHSSQVEPSEVVPVSIAAADVLPASVDASAISVRISEPTVDVAPAAVDVSPAHATRPMTSDPVPSAAESHAGMLDPWSDAPEALGIEKVPTIADAPLVPPLSLPSSDPHPPVSEDGVVTSAPAPQRSVAPAPVKPPPPARAPRPAKPPPPPKTKSQELAAALPRPEARPEHVKKPKAPEPKKPDEAEAPIGPLDLSTIDAFADLPDDSRESLAKGATVRRCSKGEAIESFSRVFVVSGDVHVAAKGGPSQATTLGPKTVLLGRGSLETTVPLRLVGASANSVIATWDASAVEAALGSCPWVEEDLRKAADRVQALAGASLGALGERLSPDLRTGIVEKLTLRTFEEHETIVTEGVPVPGILLVAVGNVELVASELVTGQVAAGQFVLPAEALSAGPSPTSARAGTGGALLLAGDRKTTQELFATEPLLLELFAGW